MPPKLETRNTPQVRLAPPLQIKLAAGATEGTVQGYASVFGGQPDSHGDIIAPGAFTRTIREHQAEGTMPVMLWSHDPARLIGRWTEMREDESGLSVRGQLNMDTFGGREAYAHVKAGDANGLSIGFYSVEGGSKPGDGGANVLTDLDLLEISVVAMPSNRRARLKSKGELEDLLHKSGLPKAAAARLASGGWPALAGADPEEEARQFQIAADRITRLTEKMRTGR